MSKPRKRKKKKKKTHRPQKKKKKKKAGKKKKMAKFWESRFPNQKGKRVWFAHELSH